MRLKAEKPHISRYSAYKGEGALDAARNITTRDTVNHRAAWGPSRRVGQATGGAGEKAVVMVLKQKICVNRLCH